ncbi:pentapeptide repeat-containing protein [Actinomadura sp. NPDC000929]|uniref:pentapeptide repeat-containing protein n=1 Tax=Actinomadura sp. NPDC000929 TaxID=3154517 RepID=UPI0033928966
MVATLITAVAAIWITTAWLLSAVDDATVSTDRARVRVEAVRTGLAAGAGSGAAVGLLLAFRRQAHQEHDTAERRITELYSTAADQLGSEKAPVRLTALYTLERLANDNPRQQQTIVNIICAYLRMPYAVPYKYPAAYSNDANPETSRRNILRYRAMRMGHPTPLEVPNNEPHEEYQVRAIAQGILSAHLRPGTGEVFWPDISLDLMGATLTNGLDLTGCSIHSANFRRATFIHGASCDYIKIAGAAYFENAIFAGPANFKKATFGDVAYFRKATFKSRSLFRRTFFTGHINFDALKGGGDLLLENAKVAITDMEQPHVPPAGWRIETIDGGSGRFVRSPTSASAGA